jgi:hypothetical protein
MTQKECRAFYDDDGNWKLTYEGEIFRTFLLNFEDLKFYRTQALITSLDFTKPSISRGKITTKREWTDQHVYMMDGNDLTTSSKTEALHQMYVHSQTVV